MPSPKNRLVHTPRYDAWVALLRIHLSKRGRKAELARHMAAERGQTFETWTVKVNRILGGQIINAEDLLAISAWIAGRPDVWL
jgi:hypothetical protein